MCIICSCVRVVREGDASIKRRTVSKCYVASSLRTRRKREKEKKGLKRHSKKEEREGLMKLITFPQSTVIEKKKHLKHPFSRPNDQMQKRFFFGCFLFVCYTKNKQTNKKQSKGAEEEASRCHPFQMLYKPPFFITGKKKCAFIILFFFSSSL